MDDRWIEKENEKILLKIIKKIEQGAPPWRQPWANRVGYVIVGARKCGAGVWPRNLRAPLTPFSPANGVYLMAVADSYDFTTNFWINQKTVDELRLDKPSLGPWSIQKGYSHAHAVYNIQQFTKDYEKLLGLNHVTNDAKDAAPSFQFEGAKVLLKTLKKKASPPLKIEERKSKASYDSSCDIIHMPSLGQFRECAKSDMQGEAHYWGTMWHEIVHWTGHEARLKRLVPATFGSKKYAYEELVAELGAAFLCSHLRIHVDIQSAGYIRIWLENAVSDEASGNRDNLLKDWAAWLKSEGLDALVKAGGHANQAAKFILNGGKMPASKKKRRPPMTLTI